MLKPLYTITLAFAVCVCSAQVKIGYNPGSVNPGAILELSNNTAAAPSTWKSFIPPKVDFTNPVFTSNFVWGIADTATTGAIIYNIGENYSNGFSGPGLYCWMRNSWTPFDMVTDKIRMSLSSSVAAYDVAAINSWVSVTASEYNNLLSVVSGSAKYAESEIYMNTVPTGGWSPQRVIGGSNNMAKVPASSYIIGWSLRTGSNTSSSQNSKLKISVSQTSGYTDYGSPLPGIGTIAANTRVYFVLKAPYIITPPTLSYTAVYNFAMNFLGDAPGGPEYYSLGDDSNLPSTFAGDSYSQVICTSIRQWK